MIRRSKSNILFTLTVALCFLLSASVFAKTIYVKSDGDDAKLGTSWSLAKKTIKAAIDTSAAGDEIWIAKGEYVSSTTITLKSGVALLGGFAGTEVSLSERDFKKNITSVVGTTKSRPVIESINTTYTFIDGLSIRSEGENGYGIYCHGENATITNNTLREHIFIDSCINSIVTDNTIGEDIQCYRGTVTISNNAVIQGINCMDGGIFTISNNRILGPSTFGIRCSSSIARITGNFVVNCSASGIHLAFDSSSVPPQLPIEVANAVSEIRGNTVVGSGIGISIMSLQNWAYPCMKPLVCNNIVKGNGNNDPYSNMTSAGVAVDGCSPLIYNNAIIGNIGHGIDVISTGTLAGPAAIVGNTILNNKGTGSCGILSRTGVSCTIANNIIANNPTGLSCDATKCVVKNNCAYNPGGVNYAGNDYTGIDGNISSDPMILVSEFEQLHLLPESPCIDSGDNTFVVDGLKDIDGDSRKLDGNGDGTATVDMGADEFTSSVPVYEPTIIRVAPDGDDSNDGLSWKSPKKNIQSGIVATVVNGGEVWVKSGTYKELVTLAYYSRVYGGFKGTETERSQRNFKENVTVIDGQQSAPVVMAAFGSAKSCIDGFTITNGKANTGSEPSKAIIYCSNSTVAITNNIVKGNSTLAGAYGVINLSSSSPVISGNLIVKNTVTAPQYVIRAEKSTPVITNNTIADNNAIPYYSLDAFLAVVSNNIIAYQPRGLAFSQVVSRNNCLFNNIDGTIPTTTGDFRAEPLFVDRANGDYRISKNSPCVNKGWNDAQGIPATDIDCQARVRGIIDVGADECWLDPATILSVKGLTEGNQADLAGSTVTAAFDGFFYVESADRVSGVRVNKAGHGLKAGSKAYVTGVVRVSDDGEVFVDADYASSAGVGSISPLAIANKSIGGGHFGLQKAVWGWQLVKNPETEKYEMVWKESKGLNNIGLLVRTCGKVTREGTDTFVSDGSGTPVKLILPSGASIDESWQYISVTGISSCEKVDGELVRVLRVRTQEDIQKIN